MWWCSKEERRAIELLCFVLPHKVLLSTIFSLSSQMFARRAILPAVSRRAFSTANSVPEGTVVAREHKLPYTTQVRLLPSGLLVFQCFVCGVDAFEFNCNCLSLTLFAARAHTGDDWCVCWFIGLMIFENWRVIRRACWRVCGALRRNVRL